MSVRLSVRCPLSFWVLTHYRSPNKQTSRTQNVDIGNPTAGRDEPERRVGKSLVYICLTNVSEKEYHISPGRYQRLDLFNKVLSVLCPNLTDASSGFQQWFPDLLPPDHCLNGVVPVSLCHARATITFFIGHGLQHNDLQHIMAMAVQEGYPPLDPKMSQDES